jgi:hypothetical protein
MLNDTKKRMNLQLFAEPEAAAETQSEVDAIEQVTKTYTEDEVKAQVQAETDRKVTKALETAKAKWLEEEQAKLKQAEELAKLSEKERLAKELEIQRNEFEAEKSKFQRERLTLQTEKDLISKDMPAEFAPFVVADTAEQTLININTLQDSWQAAIEKAIDDKVKGRTPSGNPQQQTGEVNPWKKETFNLTKQGEIIMSNPSVAEQMKRAAGK